jgi:hypothetical protein
MPTVVYKGKSSEQRIADRLKNSGGDLPADHRAVHGSGPTRTFTKDSYEVDAVFGFKKRRGYLLD